MIRILRVVIAVRSIGTLADDTLSFDALIFLAACLLAYMALRARTSRRMRRVERVADTLFITGLGLMAVAATAVTYPLV